MLHCAVFSSPNVEGRSQVGVGTQKKEIEVVMGFDNVLFLLFRPLNKQIYYSASGDVRAIKWKRNSCIVKT